MSPVAFGADGRIGGLLRSMGAPGVTRDEDPVGVDKPGPARPIVVCTRNDDLPAVLERVHPSRHPDLVFIQNGMIQPWLAEHGLIENTQGVLWVAVPNRGDEPVPGGTSVFHGRWADDVAELLTGGGVPAEEVDHQELQNEIAIKLGWILCLGPLGSATGLLVGQIMRHHRSDIIEIAAEVYGLLGREPGLDIDRRAFTNRLLQYSADIQGFPVAVKEWAWRNGWQLDAAKRLGIPQPATERWLEAADMLPAD